MKNKVFFTLVGIFFCLNSFSQQKDSIMAINRKFKREIGVDLQGLFKSTPGTALILKIKNNRNRFISLVSTKNFRFQLGLSGTIPTTDNVKMVDSSTNRYSSQEARTYSIQLMAGMEKVNFYGKFNFYYGFDFGPYYNYSNTGYSSLIYTNGGGAYSFSGGFPEQTEAKKMGVTFAPFVGAKYRISEHFSATIESAFYLSYFLSETKIMDLPYYYSTVRTNKVVAVKNSSGFDFSVKYLRFLTVNYHF
jgi:hypothetical protein